MAWMANQPMPILRRTRAQKNPIGCHEDDQVADARRRTRVIACKWQMQEEGHARLLASGRCKKKCGRDYEQLADARRSARPTLSKWSKSAESCGAPVYTSCEPCAMCVGKMYWAGIRSLVYALSAEELAVLAGRR